MLSLVRKIRNFLQLSDFYRQPRVVVEKLTDKLQSFFNQEQQQHWKQLDSTSTNQSSISASSKLFHKFKHLIESKQDRYRIRKVLHHYENLLEVGRRVPVHLTDEIVRELVLKPSKKARRRYLVYLYYKENKYLKRQAHIEGKLQKPLVEPRKKTPRPQFSPHDYRLGGNSLFFRIADVRMNFYYCNRLANAVLFGQPLVFDMSYDEHMTDRESNKASVDILYGYGKNRLNRDPFHLYFCNSKADNRTISILKRTVFQENGAHHFAEITAKSYLELFPKDKLVYLTPDGEEALDQWDHDAVYIIGALVDKEQKEKLSYTKAQSEGVRTARFPMNFELSWDRGKEKPLHLSHMVRILLELKRSGNWTKALHYVPKTLEVVKIKTESELEDDDVENVLNEESKRLEMKS